MILAVEHSAKQPTKKDRPRLTNIEIQKEKYRYRKTAEGDLYLHVFYPPGWKTSDRRPLIVFFFGGGWKGGSYTQFVPQAEYFASRGIVAACAEYRIANKHKTTPDRAVEDARAAFRWVRSNSARLGIDSRKVIGAGGSAGGHLAAAAALLDGFDAPGDDTKVSCKPDALVLFNPALNLVDFATIRDKDGKDITRAFSPTPHLKKGAPPTLLLFGTNDRMLDQGKEYLKKAKALGVRTELHTAPDEPHGFFNRSPWLEATTHKADEFLAELGYLTGKPTVKKASMAKLQEEK
jgi:acetyl esterase/lipase